MYTLPQLSMSQKYTLGTEDLKKIGVGAGVAVGGALLVYLAEVIPQVDFGAYTPIAVAIAGILINAARKWLAGYSA
jgi:hypothetical protein